MAAEIIDGRLHAEALRAKAASLRIAEWRAVDRETPQDWRTPLILDDVKGSLARGVPVVFAMPITKDYERWHGDGVFRQAERIGDNWHAMALVGYDEDRQAFRLINSWGPNWGDHGYAWIDYATFKTVEAYHLRDVVKDIVAPVMITDPEGEQFWPGQSQQLFDALPGPKVIVRFTKAEGADMHCEPMGRSLLEQRMYDWLDETLEGQTLDT